MIFVLPPEGPPAWSPHCDNEGSKEKFRSIEDAILCCRVWRRKYIQVHENRVSFVR